MLGTIPAARKRIIERIASQITTPRRNSLYLQSKAFIQAYYRGVAEEDLRERELADLAGAALAQLQFGRVRRRGQALVRVYVPDRNRDGWSSAHTCVETITDDMPFLVDSLGIVFAQMNLSVHLTVHPVLSVRRDKRGRLLEVCLEHASGRGIITESWQRIEIDHLADAAESLVLQQRLLAVLRDVRLACAGWEPMRQRALTIAARLQHEVTTKQSPAVNTTREFLEWMADDHFTFLGYQEFSLERGKAHDVLKPLPGSALGLARGRLGRATPRILQAEVREQFRDAELVIITKAPSIATVHRATYPDQISIKRFNAAGETIGERRFYGLFTSSAYYVSPREIPLLRDKVNRVIEHFGLSATSHDGKAVLHVLETYPRDELFQSGVRELVNTVRGIVNLYERRRVRLFIRRDTFRRFYSCLLYVPRDRYSTQVRERIEAIMRKELDGTEVESQVQLSDSALARLHILVRSRPDSTREMDVDALERLIAATVRTWRDELRDALIERYGEAKGIALAQHWGAAFPAAYQEEVSPREALQDIEQLSLLGDDTDGVALRLASIDGQLLHLRILRKNAPLALSDALPLLENMDFRVLTERPYHLNLPQARGGGVWIQDCELEYLKGTSLDPLPAADIFRDAFGAVWSGRTENDGFNRLVLGARLSWREVAVLRAYCRYLLQTGVPFSQAYMERTLSRHAALATLLWQLFAARFDPAVTESGRAKAIERLHKKIAAALEKVTSLDEDRILRAYLAVIMASVRTNYYQREPARPPNLSSGQRPQPSAQSPAVPRPKEYLAIKLDSRSIPDLPLPKPLFEVFVYSPRFEAVHLRNGRVARGGIRWSDRREDFRTEILGLMKAQNVKNTVIVPVGAKGGFVPKRLTATASREDMQREGIECYRSFIRGLLDLTDNLVGGKIAPPAQVIRHDGDDPYLVVAADKGTATFSDTANAIAAEYNFWLGDAFASGGSVGYDHKKMAITARGAWECVKRHFRELGMDIQSQDFSATGIGDMSGDVFGNGMLQSEHIKLIAAFDHRNIFLDPTPDAKASYRERARLFKLPRSSWEDYDRKLISPGGGVFSRASKSIALSPRVQALLGIKNDTLAPQQLVQAILRMPVDLLWNGGIGTYVKASTEAHSAVGDRSNDAVRVNGKELRCRVIGEGGNLGLSQLGRIEYALKGGRLNTDFIDNSAGVDCSDHEVNIKILLNGAVERRQLTLPQRDRLLVEMTDDVAALVLRDNYLQSQSLSISEAIAIQQLDEHAHLMRSLELSGELNRELEFLPTTEELAQRHQSGRGLTRPELAVLLAYSKISLYSRLIESDVPEDAYLSQELERYFPSAVRRRFGKLLPRHRLRREIIATAITNSLVNRMGPGFARSVEEDTGADAAAVARAYTIAREAYEIRDLWSSIEALDNRVATACQYEMLIATVDLLRFATYWLLHRHPERLDIEQQVSRLKSGLSELRQHLPELLRGTERERYNSVFEQYRKAQVDESLTARVAGLQAMHSGLDIVEVAAQEKLPIDRAAGIYFAVGSTFGLDWIRAQAEHLGSPGHWQTVALGTLRDNTYSLQRTISALVLDSHRHLDPDRVIKQWLDKRRTVADSTLQTITEMRGLPIMDFATLSVALQAVRRLTEA